MGRLLLRQSLPMGQRKVQGVVLRKVIGRIALLILLFAAVLGGIAGYNYWKNRTTDSYEPMQAASLPLIRLTCREGCSNELHGYSRQMEPASMRDVITPLSSQHQIQVSVEHAQSVDRVFYEVRSLDGGRLVEDGEITGWSMADNTMTTQLRLSNLVDDGNEYQLIFRLEKQGRNVYYYSRVIYFADGSTEKLLSFPVNFIEASVGGNTDFVVNYIQPDESMGTSDYGHVNRHSRSSMLTWKGLAVEITGEIRTEITELSATQASMTLTYPVTFSYGDAARSCTVTEYYVVRCRDGVLYLLDFERYVKENFDYSRMQFDDGNIWLGITYEEPTGMDSDSGRVHAYVYDGQLWTYNDDTKTMTEVYSYRDGSDERGSWDHHRIQTIRVTDEGNIYFMVYGYHNRGNHEGEVGISFLEYTGADNHIDEIFYIPVDFSEQILQKNMGTIAYVSQESDLLYLLYASTVYSVDLSSGEKVELAAAGSAGSFHRNEDSSLVGWQEGDGQYPNTLKVVVLSNGRTYEIAADEGEFLQIQGFLGQDLIYGVGRKSDVLIQAGEVAAMPLYTLRIAHFGEDMEAAGDYTPSGLLISGTEILENQIVIHRVTNNAGGIEEAEDDQMFLNDRENLTDGSIMRVSFPDGFQRTVSIRTDISSADLILSSDRCQIRDAQAAYQLTLSDSGLENGYYVFSRGGLSAVEQQLSQAIRKAYDEMGAVLDGRNRYLWTRGTRDLNKTLTVGEQGCNGSGDSLRACLDILLSYEGASAMQTGAALTEGRTPAQIMEEALGDGGSVMNLRGCSIGQLLYYIHLNHPVLAISGDGSAVLFIGYDSQNITIYNPVSQEISQMSQAEAEEQFSQQDCQYICWLD